MSIYLDNPDLAPDSDFEPGAHRHLVVSNKGRLLDSRRTPVSVVEVRVAVGTPVPRRPRAPYTVNPCLSSGSS